MRRALAALLLPVVWWLAGCATAQNPDPIEPFNRKMFAFNEAVDQAVLKPVATAYVEHVPSPVRTGVTNFFNNVGDLWSAVNLFLQARVGEGFSDVARFGLNTVFGILGVFDVATDVGLERHGEDLGRTFGRWGAGPGAYIVWPLLGPSTVRDSIGLPIEMQVSPNAFINDVPVRNTLTVTRVINTRANLLGATGLLDDLALDKYSLQRDAFLQRRESQIYRSERVDEPDSVEPAAKSP